MGGVRTTVIPLIHFKGGIFLATNLLKKKILKMTSISLVGARVPVCHYKYNW
jgi:hypothetical protein